MVDAVNGDTSSAGPAPAAPATPGEAKPEDVAAFEDAAAPPEGSPAPEGSTAPNQNDGDPTPSSSKNFEEISARKSDRYLSETADKSGLTSLANDSNQKQFHTIFGDTLGYDPENKTSSEYQNAESLRGAIKNKDWESAGLRLASTSESELGGRTAAFSGGDTPDTSDDTIVVDESTLNKPEKLNEGIEAELFHAFERGVHGDKSGDVQLGKDGPVFDNKDKHEPLDEGELGRRALNQWNESGSANVESLVAGDKAINRDDHFSITDSNSNTQKPISLEGFSPVGLKLPHEYPGGVLLEPTAKTGGSFNVKAASYNIYYESGSNTMDEVQKFADNRDVLSLQEVTHEQMYELRKVVNADPRLAMVQGIDTYGKEYEPKDGEGVLGGETVLDLGGGRNSIVEEGEFNPIIYDKQKFDLVDSASNKVSDSTAGPQRNATYAVLQHKDSKAKILAVNTHWNNGNTEFREQAKDSINRDIGWFINQDPSISAVTVMGDFNYSGDPGLYGLTGADKVNNGPTHDGGSNLDQVLWGSGIDALESTTNAWVYDGGESDHNMVERAATISY